MNYKIIPTETFKREVRRLAKLYPNIKNDLQALHQDLVQNPKTGTPLRHKTYKLRVKNTDIKKGKRSGYRVITFVQDEIYTVKLLMIYSKARTLDISDQEIQLILAKEGLE
ncbi:MAG: hypothetical protein U5L00_02735 [Desulfovermiculus sp.]|nr:hypothetical protein [Desulfovermiculus sp.]